jgi:hypothetical protein
MTPFGDLNLPPLKGRRMLLSICLSIALGSSGCGYNDESNGFAADSSLGTISKEVSNSARERTANNSLQSSDILANSSGLVSEALLEGLSQVNTKFARGGTIVGDTPVAIELEDWSSGSARVVGKVNFDSPQPNLVFQDSDLNSEMGEVKVTGVKESIVWAGFEFGGISFKGTSLADNGADLHQVLVGAKPSGRWASYPFANTFNAATDVTIPPPFKVKIYGVSGQVIGTLQMRDGKPINDPGLSQDRKDPNLALRPFFNCGMLLPWSSGVARPNKQLTKLFPGFIEHPESRAKVHYSTTGAFPLLGHGADGRQQINGLNQWHAMAKWPLPSATNNDVNFDKYSYDVATFYTGEGATSKSAWITGWGYEPGSVSGHDWFTGPGGMRFDRSIIPTPIAYYTSNPNYLRPKDNAPIRELVDAWGMGYFNHSGHYLTDVKQFKTIMNSEKERVASSQMGAYYGGGRVFGPLSESIDIRAVTNGSYNLSGANGGTDPSYYLDKNGRRFWNGWAVDDNHLHQTPYWHTILFNSPMHIVASRAAFNSSYLARISNKEVNMRPVGYWAPGPSYGSMNSRVQAYRWMHYALMWKSAADHPLGIARAEVEAAFLNDLRKWHDTILLPTLAETKNPYHVAVKQLGVPVLAEQNAQGKWILRTDGTALSYYHSTLFPLLKSLKLWNVIQADPKSKATIDFVMESLTKYSVDFITETDGRAEVEGGVLTVAGPFDRFEDITASSVPKSWRDWAAANPKTGAENWIKDSSGKFVERYPGQHIRAQWAFAMRDWFPEFANQRVALGASKYWDFYQEWRTNVNSKTSAYDQRGADFAFQPIPYWIIKPPN